MRPLSTPGRHPVWRPEHAPLGHNQPPDKTDKVGATP